MDPRTRWETEALRGAPAARPGPPRPTAKRRRGERDDRAWVTLREAETATSIPVSTLRKWVRRAGLPSYLESDGETLYVADWALGTVFAVPPEGEAVPLATKCLLLGRIIDLAPDGN